MALLKANGQRVFEGSITRPARGVWLARLRVDARSPLVVGAPVVIETPGLTMRGTVSRAGEVLDTCECEIVGGAGGMLKAVSPKSYLEPTVRMVAQDLAAAGGETVSPLSDKGVLDLPLTRWTRFAGSVATELRMLLDCVAAMTGKAVDWRILEDGTLWIGQHAWLPASAVHQVMEDSPADAQATVAAERPFIFPGMTIDGRKVFEVVDTFESSRVRHHYSDEESLSDVVRDVARQAVDGRDDAMRFYPARVLGTHTLGGPLELALDDPNAPTLSRVPMRLGVPGVRVRMNAGARVLVTFEGGDRRKPIAALWEHDGVAEMSLAGGSKSIARTGDTADAGTLYVTSSGSAVSSIVYVPPDAPPGTPPLGAPIRLRAKINDTGTKIKA